MVALFLTLAPAALAGAAAALCLAIARARTPVVADEPSDAIVLAAHPDDCVICAGEYVAEALRRGKSATIVYLTDGAAVEERERARARRSEALAAWSLAGLGSSSLRFLGLPHASRIRDDRILEGPVLEEIGASLARIMKEAPPGAAVFMPAEGEDHGDHRLLRALALEALAASGRADLALYECPEYNSYYSALRSPRRALAYLASRIPLAGFYRPDARATRAETISGPLGGSLPPDEARLGRKREMLARFTSENGPLLVRLFGHPDKFTRYRPGPARRALYLKFGDDWISPGLVSLWALVLLSACAFPAAALRLFADRAGPSLLLEFFIAGATCIPGALAVFKYRREAWKFVFALAALAAYVAFGIIYLFAS
jgi:LmbE family N-acetylglucosaminyl deacetylase